MVDEVKPTPGPQVFRDAVERWIKEGDGAAAVAAAMRQAAEEAKAFRRASAVDPAALRRGMAL